MSVLETHTPDNYNNPRSARVPRVKFAQITEPSSWTQPCPAQANQPNRITYFLVASYSNAEVSLF